MTLLGRLGKLEPTLTVEERLRMALAAYREGRPIEPVVFTMPTAQRPEYERMARMVMALNDRLGGFAWMLLQRADWLRDDSRTFLVLEEAAGILEEQEGIPTGKPGRDWRKRKEVSVPAFLRGLALDLRDNAVETAEGSWAELDAIERVWAKAEAELGEDPVHPHVRSQLGEAKEAFLTLRTAAGGKGEPPEPAPERIETMR